MDYKQSYNQQNEVVSLGPSVFQIIRKILIALIYHHQRKTAFGLLYNKVYIEAQAFKLLDPHNCSDVKEEITTDLKQFRIPVDHAAGSNYASNANLLSFKF